MAYKQEVISNLEHLIDTQTEIIKHLSRQDVYLVVMPEMAHGQADRCRWRLKEFIEDAEDQREEVKDLLSSIKEEVDDVY